MNTQFLDDPTDLKGILASIDLNSLNRAEKIAFCQSAALVEQAEALKSFSTSFYEATRGTTRGPGAFEKIAMELDSLSRAVDQISTSLGEYVQIAGSPD